MRVWQMCLSQVKLTRAASNPIKDVATGVSMIFDSIQALTKINA